MRPLFFVNWARVSARFTAVMWIVAMVLAFIVLIHVVPSGGRATEHAASASSSAPALARSH